MGRLTSPRGGVPWTAAAFGVALALSSLAGEAPPAAGERGGAGEHEAAAAAGEGEGAGPADGPLGAPDVRAVRVLFQRFAAAMTAGDADAVGELLSPALSPEERKRIVSRARGEFERIVYHRFAFEVEDRPAVERLDRPSKAAGPAVTDRIEILVFATYEYETRSGAGGEQGQMVGAGETSYPFRLAKADGRWGIVWSELIEQFASKSMDQLLGRVFLVVFLAAAAVFFWGWMALDAYVRMTRAGYAVAVLLTPPVGALVYFFAVYLRRMFVRTQED